MIAEKKAALEDVKKIGLLCGRGTLPSQLITYCREHQLPFFVIAFLGQTPEETVIDTPHQWVRLGAVGDVLSTLKQQEVSHVLFAGGISRPSWSELGLDWKGTCWLAKVGMKSLGDDGILSVVVSLLESEGFRILPPTAFLIHIRCPEGCLTEKQPTAEDLKDIAHGTRVLSLIGEADIGQAVVVQQELILAVEAIEGTTQMIARAGSLKRSGAGGVLVKQLKPGQNHNVDLPTIGPETIREVAAAGLVGIAVKANFTQVIDLDETIRLANKQDIFLIGMPQEKTL